jgi:uncharacterized phage-associated protein
MPTCFDVADYFIANADPDEGISNMKLQKLCAYAQAFSLVLLNRKLFEGGLESWAHGPVSRELYEAYRSCGKDSIETIISPAESRFPFTEEDLFILETVNNYYGRYAAWTLRNMSHNDFPGDFGPYRQIMSDSDIVDKFNGNIIINKIREVYP